MRDDPTNLEVTFATGATDYDDFDGLRHWAVELNLVDFELPDVEDQRTRAGHGVVVTLSRHLIDAGDAYFALDSLDGDAERVATALFVDEAAEEAIRSVSEDFTYHGALLYIDQLFVEPEYRGEGYGLHAMRQILALFTEMGATLAVCFPAPFEQRSEVPRERAISALQSYWRQVGFVELKDGVYIRRIGEE